jgi:hypothetical protein
MNPSFRSAEPFPNIIDVRLSLLVIEFGDRVEQEAQRLRLPPPAPDAISRMEETLGWACMA